MILNASLIWFGVSNGVAGWQVTAWSDHNKQAQFAELYSTAEADQQASVTEQLLTACLVQRLTACLVQRLIACLVQRLTACLANTCSRPHCVLHVSIWAHLTAGCCQLLTVGCCQVLREGTEQQITRGDVVVGDVHFFSNSPSCAHSSDSLTHMFYANRTYIRQPYTAKSLL